jgi:hypothetical protein
MNYINVIFLVIFKMYNICLKIYMVFCVNCEYLNV